MKLTNEIGEIADMAIGARILEDRTEYCVCPDVIRSANHDLNTDRLGARANDAVTRTNRIVNKNSGIFFIFLSR